MIVASVDTTSQSYALGQVVGVLSVAVVAIVLLWRLTRSWRAPSTPVDGDRDGAMREASKRRLLTIGVTVLIAAVAGAKAAASYHPEPRASETSATVADSHGQGAQTAAARSAVLPDSFSGYQLMTGDAGQRAETAVLAGRKMPEGSKLGFYDKDGDGYLDLFVTVSSVEWSPKVRKEKADKSITQEFRDFFAGAKARDVTPFEPGPYGGGLSCGRSPSPGGDQAVCAWSDATTFGGVRTAAQTTLNDAAGLTLALRNATMR
ncbi:hypothetical protein AB0D97_20835 [Streptomyces roseus]|uniref:hypothetical protein n=1 Tax=Streptomyces roseus TaxID=66430 RepID=UPI00340BEF5E